MTVDLTKPHKIAPAQQDRYTKTKYYCGAVLVPAGTEYTQHYETASWYTIHKTTEDRWYPVYASENYLNGNRWNLTARVDSVIASEFTPSSFGGVQYGSAPQGENHRNVGSPSSFSLSVTGEMFDEGKYLPVTLGFSLSTHYYSHSWPSKGENHFTTSRSWGPYSESFLKKMPPLPGAQVEMYGAVV